MIPCEIIVGFMLFIKTSAQGNGNIVTVNQNFGNFPTEVFPSTGTIANIPQHTNNDNGLWDAGVLGFPEFFGQTNGIMDDFIESTTAGNGISSHFLLNAPSQSLNQQSSASNTLNNPTVQQNTVNAPVHWLSESDFGQSHLGADFTTRDPGTVQQFQPSFSNTPTTNTLTTNSNTDNALGIQTFNTSPQGQVFTSSPNFDFGLQTNARNSITSFSQPSQSQFGSHTEVDPFAAMLPSSPVSTFDPMNSMAGQLYDPMMYLGLSDNFDLTESVFPGESNAISSSLSPALTRNAPSFDFLNDGSQSGSFTANSQNGLGSAMTNNPLFVNDQQQNQFQTSVPATSTNFQQHVQAPRGVQFLSSTAAQMERPQTVSPRRFSFAMFDDQSSWPGGILFEEFQNILTRESKMPPTLKQRKKKTTLASKKTMKPLQKLLRSRKNRNFNETY